MPNMSDDDKAALAVILAIIILSVIGFVWGGMCWDSTITDDQIKRCYNLCDPHGSLKAISVDGTEFSCYCRDKEIEILELDKRP